MFPNAVVCGTEGLAWLQGFTADFIRQCRYVPDSIGIILFFCASTVDEIPGCRGTLEKMCASEMGIMMEIMSGPGPYKPTLDTAKADVKQLVSGVLQTMIARKKNPGVDQVCAGTCAALCVGRGACMWGPRGLSARLPAYRSCCRRSRSRWGTSSCRRCCRSCAHSTQ